MVSFAERTGYTLDQAYFTAIMFLKYSVLRELIGIVGKNDHSGSSKPRTPQKRPRVENNDAIW